MSAVVLGFAGSEREPMMDATLIRSLVPFQPTLARAFARDDTLRIFGRVFWKGSAPPMITIGVMGARVSQHQTAPLSSVSLDNGRHTAVFDTMLTLKSLQLVPGDYQLVVDARLPNGQSAGHAIPFDAK